MILSFNLSVCVAITCILLFHITYFLYWQVLDVILLCMTLLCLLLGNLLVRWPENVRCQIGGGYLCALEVMMFGIMIG